MISFCWMLQIGISLHKSKTEDNLPLLSFLFFLRSVSHYIKHVALQFYLLYCNTTLYVLPSLSNLPRCLSSTSVI